MKNSRTQLIALLGMASLAQFVHAGQLTRAWGVVYAELNDGASPTWRSREEANEWVVREQARVEPVVLAILRGERHDLPWTSGLSIAQVIPTPEIRNVLLQRLTEVLNRVDKTSRVAGSADVVAIASCIKTLSIAKDNRIGPLVSELLARDDQRSSVVEQSIDALGRTGNTQSLAILRSISLRYGSPHIGRKCKLAERMIEARVAGKVFPPETGPDDLRAVTRRFLKACEAADLQAYAACFPWGSDKGIDENDMHEFLDGEHGQAALEAIQAALDANTPFEIDRENLQAKLVCDDRFLLEYIYEVDGWKIMKIRPLTQARANKRPGKSGKP